MHAHLDRLCRRRAPTPGSAPRRARAAFNNDVEYDISESDTIGYKGARLRILEATNSQITFVLLRNFNDAPPDPELESGDPGSP